MLKLTDSSGAEYILHTSPHTTEDRRPLLSNSSECAMQSRRLLTESKWDRAIFPSGKNTCALKCEIVAFTAAIFKMAENGLLARCPSTSISGLPCRAIDMSFATAFPPSFRFLPSLPHHHSRPVMKDNSSSIRNSTSMSSCAADALRAFSRGHHICTLGPDRRLGIP